MILFKKGKKRQPKLIVRPTDTDVTTMSIQHKHKDYKNIMKSTNLEVNQGTQVQLTSNWLYWIEITQTNIWGEGDVLIILDFIWEFYIQSEHPDQNSIWINYFSAVGYIWRRTIIRSKYRVLAREARDPWRPRWSP